MTSQAPPPRHLSATVAQFIHELSERHAKDREAVAVVPVIAQPVRA